ncbi:DUF4873 domain-containing protein [Nocardia sp. NBC_01499]
MLTFGQAARPAVVGDRDLWNRYRVMGKSTPPYPVSAATRPRLTSAG